MRWAGGAALAGSWRRSRSVWWAALGWLWWLALPLPLIGQQTPPGPLPGALSPSERQVWKLASEALLTRLEERKAQIASLQDSLLTLNSELTGSLQESDGLRLQLATSENSRQDLQTELTATSNLLAALRQDYQVLKASADQAKSDDQKAIDAARSERDWWMAGAAASGGLAVVLAVLAMWR